MAAQSGIRASQDLIAAFSNAVLGKSIRAIRVSIVNESLVHNGAVDVAGSLETDFALIRDWLLPTDPAFVLLRTDTPTSSGDYEWIVLHYVPDKARVRDKMLYSSSKGTLLKDLGDSKFVDSIYGSTQEELSFEGYKKHLVHKQSSAPLTEREKELAAVKAAENSAEITISSRRGLMATTNSASMAFPWNEDAEAAVGRFWADEEGTPHLIILAIDIENERIALEVDQSPVGQNQVAGIVTADKPRFLLYRAVESGAKDAVIFAMTCPYAAKVKERMLYSSARGGVISALEQGDYTITKKFELDDVAELTPELFSEAFPAVAAPEETGSGKISPKFAKPSRPGRAKPKPT
ncbi:hypothetical protein BJ742DRAFT_823076 [Cladochytrium replicatum]|nr:hypothetical protein BJ742DRAFT_823076 [Cladochytrium replicatum]